MTLGSLAHRALCAIGLHQWFIVPDSFRFVMAKRATMGKLRCSSCGKFKHWEHVCDSSDDSFAA